MGSDFRIDLDNLVGAAKAGMTSWKETPSPPIPPLEGEG